jgi:hypothetical protein
VATGSHRSRRESLAREVRWAARSIREENGEVLEALLRLSRKHRIFAPLALCVGALAMLLEGMRLLLSNWRLVLIQMLPALWIWTAMFDLKIHIVHGKSFHQWRAGQLFWIDLLIVLITIVAVYLNAVFAFAITGSKPPDIRAAFRSARGRLRYVFVAGGTLGIGLAVATTISPSWGKPWFAITLGAVVAVMMIAYVAVPARLIGVRQSASRRDKMTASVISTVLSTTVCTPPYLLGRLGILMLGSKVLFVPGVLALLVGVALQAGATGAVRAIKLGASLTAGRDPAAATAPLERTGAA